EVVLRGVARGHRAAGAAGAARAAAAAGPAGAARARGAGAQGDAARLQDRARAALHEELAVGVSVVLVRALAAGAGAEEQADHADLGELRHVRGAAGEKVLGPVVLVPGARRVVIGHVAVVRVAERDLPEDP